MSAGAPADTGACAASRPSAAGAARFHDLRHTGNTIAARMGHDSSQAAMTYQHATSEADRAIARAVSDAVKDGRKKAKKLAAGSSDKAKGKKAGKKRG